MLMDFQTFNRRELQALCKLNKIPANMTNIAMADALKSLETVEGLAEFLNPSRSETAELSIKSPKRIEVTSPMVPHTSSRTSTHKKAKIEVNEVLKTPLVSCTRNKVPETSSCIDVANQLNKCGDIVQNESLVNHEKNYLPNTPVVASTISQGTMKTETTTAQSAYNTRRSTRLAAKKSQEPGVTSKDDLGKCIQEKHDVIVLDESDENSKIEKVVNLDTTIFESGVGKVDCCKEVDNLKVKLIEIFGQIEDVDLEERQNKEAMECNVDSINSKKQKTGMNSVGQAGEPQESLTEVKRLEEILNPPSSKTAELSIKWPQGPDVTSKDDLGKCIQEKHDVVVLDESDENLRIEKVVHVDTTTLESGQKVGCCVEVENLKVKLVEIFEKIEDVNLEKRQNNFEDKSGQVDNLKLDDHNVDEVMNAQDMEENVSGNTVDSMNLKKQKAGMEFEGPAGEPQESLNEVERIEEFFTPISKTTELSILSPKRIELTSPRVLHTSSRKKAKIEVNQLPKTPLLSINGKNDVATHFNETEDAAKNKSLLNHENNCIPNTPVVAAKRNGAKLTPTHDVVVLDSKIEKVVHVDVSNTTLECGEQNLKVKPVENVDLESREENFHQNEALLNVIVKGHDDIDANVENPSHPSILKPQLMPCAVQCNGSENENTVGDFIHLNNENPSQPDNHNADVVVIAEGIEGNNITGTMDDVVVTDFVNPKRQEVSDNKENNNEKEVVRDEKPKNLFNNNSLRQLKKKLKANLLNSPTSIKIKTEVSDNSDIKKVKPQVVEENEKEAVENDKAKSLNNTCSLRQLKKQLKAISNKYNMDASKGNSCFV
ncbi:hypothetical protein L1887_30132 [Cichorium endivia]|nr:hypothetical protein L1887_30132 [Cichorium endivia]